MRARVFIAAISLGVAVFAGAIAPHGEQSRRATLLEDLTWIEAEKVLTASAVVVIPLGAASKEHGPHLKLNNDWLIAEYLQGRILSASDVRAPPTLCASFSPPFVD